MHKNQMPTLVPLTSNALSDVWELGNMTVEMWTSTFSTINSRADLWQKQMPFDPKMIKENHRMVTEKLAASGEIGVEMQKAWMNMLSGGQTPWWSTVRRTLEPLHRLTTANSKRLSK